MSKRKHGLGLLVAVAALGVMAFASSAQALTPQFTINGVKATTATIQAKQEGRGTLLIPGLNTEVNCEKVSLTDGLILNSTDGHAKVLLYEECSTLSITTLATEIPCHVSDVHTKNPTVLHITALDPLILPIEFGSGDYGVLAEGISVFINFLSGTGCPLPLKTEVKGTVCALVEAATNETTEPLALFSEAIQKSAGCEDKLLYGAQESFIQGSAVLTDTLGRKLGVKLL